jgi:uncharacterized membrane protein
MEQYEINDAEWERRHNWHGGWLGLYSSARDNRVWVPKRNPAFGWTLNLAHLAGRVWLTVLLGLPLLVVVWVGWHTR